MCLSLILFAQFPRGRIHTRTGPTDSTSATQNSATTLKWGSYFYPVNQPKGMRQRGWNKPEREILTFWIIQCSSIIFLRSLVSSTSLSSAPFFSPSTVVTNGQFEPTSIEKTSTFLQKYITLKIISFLHFEQSFIWCVTSHINLHFVQSVVKFVCYR